MLTATFHPARLVYEYGVSENPDDPRKKRKVSGSGGNGFESKVEIPGGTGSIEKISERGQVAPPENPTLRQSVSKIPDTVIQAAQTEDAKKLAQIAKAIDDSTITNKIS